MREIKGESGKEGQGRREGDGRRERDENCLDGKVIHCAFYRIARLEEVCS